MASKRASSEGPIAGLGGSAGNSLSPSSGSARQRIVRDRPPPFDQLVNLGQERSVFVVEIEPFDEGVGLAVLKLMAEQRVLAEEVAQLQHVFVDLGKLRALHDDHEIAVAEPEKLAFVAPDQRIEGLGGDPEVMVLAKLRLEQGKPDMHRFPAAPVIGEAFRVVEKQILLAGKLFLLIHAE